MPVMQPAGADAGFNATPVIPVKFPISSGGFGRVKLNVVGVRVLRNSCDQKKKVLLLSVL